MMLRNAGLLALLLIALGASAQTRDRSLSIAAAPVPTNEQRYALVIGNSAYTHGALKNPVNDARAMAKTLAASGFNVRLLEDASLVGMQRAVRLWGNDLAKGGVGLFYYAGHGMQVKGRNFLVPVNAEIEQEDEIEFGSLDVNLVLAKMDSAKNGVNIVILDACRNNPFARSFRVAASGLAQMDAPTGTFIAFATAPGSTASDGPNSANGVYTRHLLREVPVPGVPIEQVFKRVRNAVMSDTKGLQVPWESSSLRGEFVFIPGAPTEDVLAVVVADAVRREREDQQRHMNKVIREALERQRAEFQVQLAALRESADPKPVLASAAPVQAVSQPVPPALPQPGDNWTYQLLEWKDKRAPQRTTYDVHVVAATPDAILDRFSVAGSEGEWAHSQGGYILSQGASLFSPYLGAFDDLIPGKSVAVAIMDPACRGNYHCQASAKVAGRERITVQAGTFDAVKVVVDHIWLQAFSATWSNGRRNGGRTLTAWYSPEAKRVVKFSSRLNVGDEPAVDSNFDLELVSYQVK